LCFDPSYERLAEIKRLRYPRYDGEFDFREELDKYAISARTPLLKI
jgi:hypothetical protein